MKDIGRSTSPEKPVAPEFFNPYHFVNVDDYTPRYPHIPHDRFQDNCGNIRLQVEFTSPVFIPDALHHQR